MKVRLGYAGLALIVAAVMSAAPAANEVAMQDGWTNLFDGKSLTGWRGYSQPDATKTRWKVESGMLTVDPGDGTDTRGARDLITVAHVRQLRPRIRVEGHARAATAASSTSSSKIGPSAIGHEYQIIDDEKHTDAKIGPHRQTAAFYDVLPAANRPIKPAGEFNQSRVVVKGQHVEHYLNGTRVLQYRALEPGPSGSHRQEQVQGHRALRQAAEGPHPAAGSRRPCVVPLGEDPNRNADGDEISKKEEERKGEGRRTNLHSSFTLLLFFLSFFFLLPSSFSLCASAFSARATSARRTRAQRRRSRASRSRRSWGTTREKAARLADPVGATAYDDLDRFLDHKPMDLVAIGTPSGVHAEQAMAAVGRGLHVLVEKPVDISTKRVDALIEAADRGRVKVGVFFQDRLKPDVVRFKDLVESGKLGIAGARQRRT